jgi:sterol desaturase/sphingolipid hydroxylase (fatty acid hydroxylase superfamily)
MSLLGAYGNILASVVILTALFYVVERILPAEPSQTIGDRLANWLYLPIVTLWAVVLQTLLAPWYAFLLRVTGGGILQRLPLVEDAVLTVAFVVLWDVWQYWIHRWQHTSPLLWETHKFHHSDAALNVSSQARHHLLSYVVYFVGYAPMVLLFGAFTPHLAVSIVMFRVWGFVNHANVRMSFGPLTRWIAGPQWHRIHHSIREEHFDTNFAAFFPFIDRHFGTYYEPARGEYPPTGVPAQRETLLRQATISPLAGWWRALRRGG